MSTNLKLEGFELWQTPSSVTWAAIASDPCAGYIEWLDSLVAQYKPNLHPRASNAQRKAVMSSRQWKDWEQYRQHVEDHKAALRAHLEKHPRAQWFAL